MISFTHFFNSRLFVISLLCVCVVNKALMAQLSVNSPYSGYGIGDINGNGFGNIYAMGGAGTAIQNDSLPVYLINNSNPASYVSNNLTTAEIGLNMGRIKIQNAYGSQAFFTGNIGHIAIVLPVIKGFWGTGIGLKPYSSVGYRVADTTSVGGKNVDLLYDASGGINQFYWGNAIRPFGKMSKKFYKSEKYKLLLKANDTVSIHKQLRRIKNLETFSLGLNASYIFGNFMYSQRADFPPAGYAFNTRSTSTTRVSDFTLDYGAQYAYTIDSVRGRALSEHVKLLFGATLSTKSIVSAQMDSLAYSYFYNIYNQEVVKDTINNVEGIKGDIHLPLSYSFGLGFRKGTRWLVVSDYAIQQWSSYKAFNASPGFKNSMRISVGGQYVPNSEGNYFGRIHYRLGARYNQTMLVINGHQLTEQVVTFGFGFPVSFNRYMQSFSMVNLGFEVGSRGATSNGLIKEQFYKVVVSFTMNDKWFLKPKYD